MSIDLRRTPRVIIRPSEGESIDLNDVETVWWRRPRRPVLPQSGNAELLRFVESEWRQFLSALELLMRTRWINSPAAEQRAGVRAWQLVQARDCGFAVPETLMTNDPPAVHELFDSGSPLIYKRLGAAPCPLTATKPFLESDLDRLCELSLCPAIFQPPIGAKMDIRVTIAGPVLHAVEIHSQAGGSPLDWRFDHSVPFAANELPHEVEARAYWLSWAFSS